MSQLPRSLFQLQEPGSSIQATLEQGSWIGNNISQAFSSSSFGWSIQPGFILLHTLHLYQSWTFDQIAVVRGKCKEGSLQNIIMSLKYFEVYKKKGCGRGLASCFTCFWKFPQPKNNMFILKGWVGGSDKSERWSLFFFYFANIEEKKESCSAATRMVV